MLHYLCLWLCLWLCLRLCLWLSSDYDGFQSWTSCFLTSDGAARFFGARCGTPCHAMPRFDRAQGVPRRVENVAWRGTSENFGATRGTPRAMSCHVYPKTWHGVALHTMPRATWCHVLISLKSPFYCLKIYKNLIKMKVSLG